MKKSILVLLTLVPVIVGYAINWLLSVPGLSVLPLYLLPLLTTVFWFYLGRQYAKTDWNAVLSVLIGNAVGLVSLLLYIWQFLLETDETRNIVLAVLSQMFMAAVPTYLFGRIPNLFETQPNYAGIATMTALEVLSVVFMMIVFVCGYVWQKRRYRSV